MTWCDDTSFHKESENFETDMGTKANSHSHCTSQLMRRKLHIVWAQVQESRPSRPQDNSPGSKPEQWHLHSAGCYVANKWSFVLVLFWDYGNFKVVAYFREETVDFPSFKHWIVTTLLFFAAWRRKQNWTSLMKYLIVITGGFPLQVIVRSQCRFPAKWWISTDLWA